jgi:hypothetical protein
LTLVGGLGGFPSTLNVLSANLLLYLSANTLLAAIVVGARLRQGKAANRARWKGLAFVIRVVFAFPFLGGVFLLGNGRLEDQLALQHLDLYLPPKTSLDLTWLLSVTGLWLAILIGWVNLINLKVEDPARAREPRTLYLPDRYLTWTFLSDYRVCTHTLCPPPPNGAAARQAIAPISYHVIIASIGYGIQ